MINATHYYLERLLNQLSNDCGSAQARIRTSTTMQAVKFAANLHANPMIRSLPQVRQALHRVHDCAEKRMEVLLDQQLKALEIVQSSDELRRDYGRLVRHDWSFLRGDYGRVYVHADREYHRLLHRLVQCENAADAAEPPPELEQDDQDHCAPAP
ncbi:MAG: hypothetical protein K2X55_12200 [Burkholderiaceae bacterium]|nr:hypothetical protein [Burkholderiaceae bacterium]